MKIEPVYKISYIDTYRKYKDIAKVEYELFLNRMINDKTNFTLETALLTPKTTVGKDEWRKVALANGIKEGTYKSRIAKGWDREEAATTLPARGGRPKKDKNEHISFINYMFETHGKDTGYKMLSKRMKEFYRNNKELFEDVL
ncbi:hypothetical protein ETI10_01615 [Macrococcoides goetzii]|nr:hypothetical protein [Macrococcus goetzii]TDM41811.1 hypothetical protein ETI10_01615 [Macrococcus goetzii]